jgi:NAD(P)-dependent dehydrogenase (short-subunit alcohol dehydrogenase family)
MSGNVLVTGASTGIGEATALHLADRGWQVFAGVRKEDDGARLQSQDGSGRLRPVLLDVTDEAGVQAALATVAEQAGSSGLQGLVNNAGVARGGPMELLPLDEWREQLEVNVIGQLAVTKAALPAIRHGGGRIVFIGSIAGRVAAPLTGPYSASKHAIEAIGSALREELRPWRIPVAVVEPGVIKSPIWAKADQKAAELEVSLGDDAQRLYGEQLEAIKASIRKNDAGGIEPIAVAKAIEHALTSSRPRHRYLVGPDAKVAGNLVRIVPDRAWAALSRRLLAL